MITNKTKYRTSVLGFSCFCFSRGSYIDLDLNPKSAMVMASVMARNPFPSNSLLERESSRSKDNDESRGAYMDGSDCERVAQDFQSVIGSTS